MRHLSFGLLWFVMVVIIVIIFANRRPLYHGVKLSLHIPLQRGAFAAKNFAPQKVILVRDGLGTIQQGLPIAVPTMVDAASNVVHVPDPVVDPEYEGFAENVAELGRISGIACDSYRGYLDALRERRAFFRSLGATATDHGHPSACTADLPRDECARLFSGALEGSLSAQEAELFRGQMLLEMALMSLKGFQGKGSPDRVDALVWALFDLVIGPTSLFQRPQIRVLR